MNKAIYRISLDIHDTSSQVSLSVKKGDTARSIHIILTEKGKPYKIAEGCFATLSGKKADGNYLYNDCIIKDNIIIYDFTKQTTPVVGKVDCDINLYNANGDSITSPHFVLIVEDRVYNGEEIESSPEATALIHAVFQAEESEQKAKTSAEAAKSAQEAAESSADEAKESADATAECLKEIKTKLANGEFKGETGPVGPQGVSGVYLGSGEMPEGYNVQIDPDGKPIEVYTKEKADNKFATKEEVGNIETALDNIIAEQEAIIAIQNALIGGDSV